MWQNRKGVSAVEQPSPAADDGLVSWRETQLVRAGFDRRLAARLAADRGMDLHALIDLAERGCPPELAARILAPLDRELEPC